jgi:transcriptional regulator with XRE-family HTH domain
MNDCQGVLENWWKTRTKGLNYRSWGGNMLLMREKAKVHPYWETIRARRFRMGLSVEELAHRAGITASYLYRIENGKVDTPSYATVRSLAEEIGMAVDELMGQVVSGQTRAEAVPTHVLRFAHFVGDSLPVGIITRLEDLVQEVAKTPEPFQDEVLDGAAAYVRVRRERLLSEKAGEKRKPKLIGQPD